MEAIVDVGFDVAVLSLPNESGVVMVIELELGTTSPRTELQQLVVEGIICVDDERLEELCWVGRCGSWECTNNLLRFTTGRHWDPQRFWRVMRLAVKSIGRAIDAPDSTLPHR